MTNERIFKFKNNYIINDPIIKFRMIIKTKYVHNLLCDHIKFTILNYKFIFN